MCLIIFAHQAVEGFPLILAANRDEFFARPTAHADFWDSESDQRGILAGKDLVAGGTWLGINTNGRFAAVTNIRDPSQMELKPRSRGELTRNFLAGNQTPEQYCEELAPHFDEFAGYNLLVGDHDTLFYVNNFEQAIWPLEAGVYGLSNALLNSDWPKVSKGREQLEELIKAPAALTTDLLIDMMANREQAADDALPDTGISKELERQLSPAFIANTERHYGTRCSTAIIRESGAGTEAGAGAGGGENTANTIQEKRFRFSELNFNDSGEALSRHYFESGQ